MNLKKYCLISCFLIFIAIFSLRAQGWERTFGNFDVSVDLVIADNGDPLVLANDVYRAPFYPYIQGGKIFRHDPFGNLLFEKLVEGAPNEFEQYASICKSNDGGYAAVGFTFEPPRNSSSTDEPEKLIFVKINEDGSQKLFQLTELDSLMIFPKKIIRTSGGYLVGGLSHSVLGSPDGSILMKFDESGTLLWHRIDEEAYSIEDLIEMPNGDLVVTGNSPQPSQGLFYAQKIDAAGNEIWETTLPAPKIREAITIEKTMDGGFFFGASSAQTSNNGGSSLELLKLDADGNFLWRKSITGSTGTFFHDSVDFEDIIENSDSSIWALTEYAFDLLLFKFDKNGNEISKTNFGDYFNAQSRIFPTGDGGNFIASTNNGGFGFLARTDQFGKTLTNNISGKYAADNNDCLLDSNDRGIAGRIIEVVRHNVRKFIVADSNGEFSMRADTGEYLLRAMSPNPIWEICQDSQLVDFQGFNLNDTVNFLINEREYCPFLTVNVSAPRMRRCFENTVHVNYCNEGSKPAEDAFIEVMLDARLTATSATLPWTSVSGNTYTFEVGDLDIFECGDFNIITAHICDSVQLGETFCMEAHIFPDSLCVPIDSLWDGSSLSSRAICEGDSVRFEIQNTGSTMQQSAEFIIIEDDMVIRSGNVGAMPAMGITELAVVAEGGTYRLEVNQAPGHPFRIKTATSLEACGLNPIGQFSTGFITAFSMTDAEPFLDTECVEVRGSYDPNDKEAFPKGVCSRNFIFEDTPLEYKIRFQNTGTDTAFRVEIRDTLSELLDPTTLEIGGASHGFDWDFTGDGVLIFTFENIMLPDSNINETASNGFIQYKIKQRPGNAIDAEIHNNASIYFDFNEPIKTNTVRHTIGDDFLTRALGDLMISGNVTWADGSPVDSAIVFLSNNCITFTDSDGDYFFENIEENQNYEIRVMKDGDIRERLTVLDYWAIGQHIQGFDTLSFFQLLAADANNSSNVSVVDLVAIRKVILGWVFPDGVVNEFPNNVIWRFLNKKDINQDFIKLNNLSENSFENDFVIIKTGDVISSDSIPRAADTPKLIIQDSVFCTKNFFRVPIYLSSEDTLVGVQFKLEWDSSILLLAGADFDFNEVIPGNGFIQFISTEKKKYDGREPVFEILFLVDQGVGDSTEIKLSTDFPAQTISVKGEFSPIEISNPIFKILEGERMNIGVVSAQDSVYCNGDSVRVCLKVEGGLAPYEYSWGDGLMEQCRVVHFSETLSYQATDSMGCAVSSFFAHDLSGFLPKPMELENIIVRSSTTANDGEVRFSNVFGGTPPYRYEWSNGDTTQYIFNLAPGDYTLTITDANDCIKEWTFTVGSTSSIANINNETFLKITPNPTNSTEKAVLTIESAGSQIGEVVIHDIAGKRLWAQKFETTGNNQILLPQNQSSGLYLATVRFDDGSRKTLKWTVD